MRPLGCSGERVLRALGALQRERGYPPSRRELAERAGFASLASLSPWLARLEDEGLIHWDQRRARGVRLSVRGWHFLRELEARDGQREHAAG